MDILRIETPTEKVCKKYEDHQKFMDEAATEVYIAGTHEVVIRRGNPVKTDPGSAVLDEEGMMLLRQLREQYKDFLDNTAGTARAALRMPDDNQIIRSAMRTELKELQRVNRRFGKRRAK